MHMCPLSTVHCRVHTFVLIFLHPLLSVRGSHPEVTFDKRFLSDSSICPSSRCVPHKPQATIRLTFHREIAGILCCHAIVPANATITNIRRSISPPFCFQEKKLLHQSCWSTHSVCPQDLVELKSMKLNT